MAPAEPTEAPSPPTAPVTLLELRLAQVRVLESATLSLAPGLNLITGDNGAGKTSLLEAVHLLGRGRSFRTSRTVELIHHGADALWVAGRLEGSSHRSLDVQCDRAAPLRARLDGVAVDSLAAMSQALPLQLLEPGIHRLLEEGPARRRPWLDWTVFHVEQGFGQAWQRYMRALRQRNAALQRDLPVTPWEGPLLQEGEAITLARARTVAGLQPIWERLLPELDLPPVALGFHAGWSREESLRDALERHRAADAARGRTLVGPHRFDVRLRADSRPAREVVSRGQQKLLAAAMVLTATQYVAAASGRAPLLLLDDPAAELDAAHARALLAVASRTGGQRLVTALHADGLSETPAQVFHVEQGRVKAL